MTSLLIHRIDSGHNSASFDNTPLQTHIRQLPCVSGNMDQESLHFLTHSSTTSRATPTQYLYGIQDLDASHNLSHPQGNSNLLGQSDTLNSNHARFSSSTGEESVPGYAVSSLSASQAAPTQSIYISARSLIPTHPTDTFASHTNAILHSQTGILNFHTVSQLSTSVNGEGGTMPPSILMQPVPHMGSVSLSHPDNVLSTFPSLQTVTNHQAGLNANTTREGEQRMQSSSVRNTHKEAATPDHPVSETVSHTGTLTNVTAHATAQELNSQGATMTANNTFVDTSQSESPVNPNAAATCQSPSTINSGPTTMQTLNVVPENEQQKLMIRVPLMTWRFDMSDVEQGRGDTTGKRKAQEGGNAKVSKRQK